MLHDGGGLFINGFYMCEDECSMMEVVRLLTGFTCVRMNAPWWGGAFINGFFILMKQFDTPLEVKGRYVHIKFIDSTSANIDVGRLEVF